MELILRGSNFKIEPLERRIRALKGIHSGSILEIEPLIIHFTMVPRLVRGSIFNLEPRKIRPSVRIISGQASGTAFLVKESAGPGVFVPVLTWKVIWQVRKPLRHSRTGAVRTGAGPSQWMSIASSVFPASPEQWTACFPALG
jgi:hypothetical protein